MIERSSTRLGARRRRIRLLRGVGFVAASCLVLGVFLVSAKALEIHRIPVNGLLVPAEAIEEWGVEYDRRWRSREITLLVGDRVFRRPRSAFYASLDVDQLAKLVQAFSASEVAARPPSVEWRPRMDRDGPVEALAEIRAEVAGDGPAEAKDRRNLDMIASKRLLRTLIHDSGLVAILPERVIKTIRSLDIDPRVLSFRNTLGRNQSSYRTSGKSKDRARNIELAARLIDGVLIAPGEELSFNEVVGPRTFSLGFGAGPEIQGGKVVDGIGGGICQVASALYAAALLAALDITDHSPHSKRPRYAKLGLDSAVAWGHKDLRIKNPFREYVRIWAHAQDGTLVVELRADRPRIPVSVVTKILEGAPSDRSNPLVIERIRTIQWPGREVEVEREPERYPAEKGAPLGTLKLPCRACSPETA